jgi:hypothetical protein
MTRIKKIELIYEMTIYGNKIFFFKQLLNARSNIKNKL